MSRRRGIEALQNLAIAFLAASALLLVLLVVSYDSGRDGQLPSWQELFPPAGEGGTASASDLTALSAPVDIVVNGKLLARGDVVVIDDNFGVRITEILGTRELLESLKEDGM